MIRCEECGRYGRGIICGTCSEKLENASEHRVNLLGSTLRDVLITLGVLNEDSIPSGPELITAANEYINSRKNK